MGHKVNPIGLRVGINRTWDSRWFASRGEYGKLLHEDMHIRDHILKQRRQAGIARVVIERPHKKCRVTVHTARPGVLIGKKGADIEKLRSELAKLTASEVHLNIVEVRKPEIDATLVAETIAQQLERRVAFRRAMKRAVQSALRLGALGIRINCSGRLGGAEIARVEWYREGRVPLHTLRADIDFGYGVAQTAYGVIGVKVWIFKGEIMDHDPMAAEKRAIEAQEAGGGGRRRGGGDAASWAERQAEWRARRRERTERSMLQPIRTKYRKAHKGRIHGNAKGGTTLNFGSYGLKAVEPERVTARQIEAARRAITRAMKRAGRVWIRIFPDVPVTKKPAEVRMGSGKGAPELWVARVKPGRIMFELDGVTEGTAREALDLGAAKLPIKTRFVKRQA
jgi:small subunit ribosomal protein S3